jgi:hypothetical protein
MKKKNYPRQSFPPARRVVKLYLRIDSLQTGYAQGANYGPSGRPGLKTGRELMLPSINRGSGAAPASEKPAFFC